MNNEHPKRGFTLIELMIVVAIIGILAAIAIPKFSNLITKSNEANTKGNLGTLRSAITIYYADTEGWYPGDTLASMTTNSKYLPNIPTSKLPSVATLNIGHPDASSVTSGTGISDAGGWVYDNTPADINWGRVLVACTHKDSKGNLWTAF